MKKLYKALLMVAALTFGATSCSDAPLGAGDDTQIPELPSTQNYEISLNVGLESESRAIFGGDNLNTMSWESGDALGLFIHDANITDPENPNKHIANNAQMVYTGEAGNFSGVIPHNPANPNRNSWYMFAYYPYNTAAGERDKYDADSWTINHASRQVQIDANHSNYDNYAFFSSNDFIEWTKEQASPRAITLWDRTAALRFLVKAGELNSAVSAQLENENIEEAVIYVVNSFSSNLDTLSRADGVTPLSGHFKFDHTNGTYTAVDGETVNYIEVDFLAPSTRNNNFKINITTNNDTYVWAVVPPFTLKKGQYLVAEFHTASYKVVYTYGGKLEDVAFTGNNTYNFKKVTATSSNTFPDVPQVHTNSCILGATVTDANDKKSYPESATLSMEVDLPIKDGVAGHSLKYYIRYGYCNNCNHGGLETPWTDNLENSIVWAHEAVLGENPTAEALATFYATHYEVAVEKIDNNDAYRVAGTKIIGNTYLNEFVDDGNGGKIVNVTQTNVGDAHDVELLKAAFAANREPVFQAYVVCQNSEHNEVYYGEVVHVDLNPEVSNVAVLDFKVSKNDQQRMQLKLSVAAGYYVNSHNEFMNSLRIYRKQLNNEFVNSDGSLNVSLDYALANSTGEAVRLGFNTGTFKYNCWGDWANSQGLYVMLNNANQSLQGGIPDINDHDDPSGAYCIVYQAYNESTRQLEWVRIPYFRLRDMSIE